MDALIARIKKRVAEPSCAVDAAAWVRPMPTIAPPATLAEVDAAEIRLGFALPPLLRRLYTEIGNGGFGPKYGLEGVPSHPPIPYKSDIVGLYEQYKLQDPDHPAFVWPRGVVPLIGGGCLYMECVDFLTPPHRVTMFDGGNCDLQRPVVESLRPVAVSLEARLEAWLAGT